MYSVQGWYGRLVRSESTFSATEGFLGPSLESRSSDYDFVRSWDFRVLIAQLMQSGAMEGSSLVVTSDQPWAPFQSDSGGKIHAAALSVTRRDWALS